VTRPRFSQRLRQPATALAGVLSLTALILMAMGRTWWCKCGLPVPWSWDIWSMHNSQHLMDAYTFSHIQHGFVFYGLFYLLLRRRSHLIRFTAALTLEAAWEILENTSFIIERYREATISLDYFGDTILNSLSDILACAFGYGLAFLIPAWSSVLVFTLIELVMIYTLRDSLLINVLMLVSPLEAVRTWQMGGK
jgi:hypothetical protein